MQRLFTSGSRQAPDPYDQFLEQHNFYRKHTARDSSCLFRVISEQMYDTQIHHLEIRLQCVQYMRKHRKFFQNLVVRDIDEYLDDLAKPKTFGSLVELQALGFMFQRNVLLYEPYNLGSYFCSRAYFYKVFRVFYSPERHFDSVFPCDYIKDIAICQAICYEILYKDLFELPDVNYAVEKMLHGGAYESSESRFDYTNDGYASRVYLTNGRHFDLDIPGTTNCILENDKLCHFHYPNFPRFTEELQKELRNHANHTDSIENMMINRTFESLLPDKYVSCVRQLLREGITPFPYKVAKALDPSMYRNIEFDAWNEARKEQRLANWYSGDANFKVGAKCNVRLKKSENDLYTCHIQEISMDKGYCVVFIEQLGEKRMVPYESLTPLPPEQFKPWSLPYRLQRHVRYPRHYNYQFKFNGSFGNGTHMDLCTPLSSIKSENWDDFNEKGGGGGGNNGRHVIHPWYNKEGYVYRLRQYTNLDNFQPPTMEYCTMPLTLEFNSVKQSTSDNQAKNNDSNGNETIAAIQNSNPTSTDLVVKTENNEEQNGNGNLAPANDGPGNALIPVNNEENLVNNFDNLSLEPAITTVNMTSTYMSDGCCYYGTYSSVPYFGPVDDFYSGGFGYDYSMNCPSGPVYYMYTPQPANFSYAAPNMYISAPAPAPAAHALSTLPAHNPPISYQTIPPPLPQPQLQSTNQNNLLSTNSAPALQSPYIHSSQSTQTTYSSMNMQYNNQAAPAPQTAYSTPNIQNMHTTSSSNSYHSPMPRNRYNQNNMNTNETPTNGRINMEAKKSVKANGIDLPQDINTLRFFYNLGIDYHKLTGQKPKLENGLLVDKSQNDQQHQAQQLLKEKEKLDENANSHDMIKSDANNNPTNYNSNKNPYHPRRFNNHRFFGSARERTNAQRPPNPSSNTNQGYNNNRNQNIQNDYNHNVINKASSYHSKPSGGGNGNVNSASTPNSSRAHLMSSGSGPNTGSNSHSGSSVSSGRGGGSSQHGNNGNENLTRSSPLLNETPSGNSGGSASGSGQVSKNSYQSKANRFLLHHSNENHNGKSVSSSRHTPNTYSNHQNGVGGGGAMNGPYEQIGDGLHSVQSIYNGPPPNTPSSTAVPPPPPHFANGMFIPMGPPPPYGMYTPNGPPPQAGQTPGGTLNGPTGYLQPPPTPSGGQHFPGTVPAQYSQMPPPSGTTLLTPNGMSCPAPLNNGANSTLYVPTPVGSDISENTNANGLINPDGSTPGAQPYYQPITYPPPGPPPQLAGGIPFFYPTIGGPNIHGNGMIMNNNSQNPGQVYWSQPPAPPAHTGPNLAPQQSHSSENFVIQKPSNDNVQSSNSNHSTGGSNKRNNYSKSNINANTGGK